MSLRSRSLILMLNEAGDIQEVLQNFNFGAVFTDKFPYLLGAENSKTCLNFISRIRDNKKSDFQYIYYQESMYVLTGCLHKDGILAVLIDMAEEELIKELMNMNTENVNLIRELQKDLHNERSQMERTIFDEISKLNNELVNAQREISKINGELEQKNKLLQKMAIHDNLTGLYNRQYMKLKFEELRILRMRKNLNLNVVMIDLNNFKIVNDTLGHDAGDKLLQSFASVCNNNIRSNYDFVFRIGGDEFLIFMLDCEKSHCESVCTRINFAFQKHTDISSLAYGIYTIGSEEDLTLDYCMEEADKEMYINKRKQKSL